jgi:hypothetical protein
MAFAVGTYLGGNPFIQKFGTGKTQGAVYKIVLIVNDKQIAVHIHISCVYCDFKIANLWEKVNGALQPGKNFGMM